MTFLERLCSAFNLASLPYAIVGGHAVALHGAVRGTVDIDFVIKWNANSLRKAVSVLSELGLVSRLPITAEDVFNFRDEYIRNRNLIAWNFYNPNNLSEQIDLIINYDLSSKRTKIIQLGNTPIRLLNIQDLINMKLKAGREQDLHDVEALKSLSKLK